MHTVKNNVEIIVNVTCQHSTTIDFILIKYQ